MKCSILLIYILFGLASVLAIESPRKINWNKVRPIDALPAKFHQKWNANHAALARNPGGRIIGGEEVKRGTYPHQAGLIIDIFSFCGGSLISNLYVMTAAHCTYGAYTVDVYLGAHNIYEDEEEGRLVLTCPYENLIVHAAYDPYSISNDISLIMLPRRITFTDRIQPIRLPTRSEALDDLENLYLTASGWGRDSDSATSISPVLRSVELQVQPVPICKHFFSDIILPSNICTNSGRGQGTCSGDSGGPLIINKTNTDKYIVGLTSFGSSISCVDAGWPSVFTYVGAYLNWIRDNTDIIIEN